MSEEDRSSSLFDMASKMQKKGKEAASKKGNEEVVVPSDFMQIDDLDAAFEKYKKLHEEIKKSVEDSFEKAKISPRQLQEYVDNPANFSAADGKAIKKTKQEIQEKLEALLPKKAENEEVKEETKEKKPKSGFVSKKRWLSMH